MKKEKKNGVIHGLFIKAEGNNLRDSHAFVHQASQEQQRGFMSFEGF